MMTDPNRFNGLAGVARGGTGASSGKGGYFASQELQRRRHSNRPELTHARWFSAAETGVRPPHGGRRRLVSSNYFVSAVGLPNSRRQSTNCASSQWRNSAAAP